MDLKQFSPASQQSLDMATRFAWEYKSGYIGVEHVFLALLSVGGADVQRAFHAARLDPERLEKVVASWLGEDSQRIKEAEIVFSPRMEATLRVATLFAARFGEDTEPVHILRAILEDPRSVPTRVLDAVRSRAESSASKRLLRETERILDLRRSTKMTIHQEEDLLRFASPIVGGKIVGRSDAFAEIAQSLVDCLRPLVVGEQGIGKASLFRGLVGWLAGDDAPNELRSRRLLRVDSSSLRFGLRPGRDHFLQLSDFFADAWHDDDVVLVLENLPYLLDENSGPGAAITEAVRQAVNNGTIRCAATANVDGFTRLEKINPTLLRKFSPLAIKELTPEQVLAVLASSREGLEEFHDTSISDEALESAIELSIRYLPNARLPGKAVDLLDHACSWELLTGLRPRELVDEVSPAIETENSIDSGKLAVAASRSSGVQLKHVLADDSAHAAGVRMAISQSLVGQDAAIDQITRVFSDSYERDQQTSLIRAAMVFHGPPGVGKSEAAKALTGQLCGRSDMIFRVDLADYPGERGLEELFGDSSRRGVRREGVISRQLRRAPWGVICLDGADRAEPDVLDKFAEIIRTGQLRVEDGLPISATNAVLVFSCQTTGPGAEPEISSEKLRAVIDAEVAFDFLTKSELAELLEFHLDKVREELGTFGLEMEMEPEVHAALLKTGFDGARALERSIDAMLMRPIMDKLPERSPEDTTVKIQSTPGTANETMVSFVGNHSHKISPEN